MPFKDEELVNLKSYVDFLYSRTDYAIQQSKKSLERVPPVLIIANKDERHVDIFAPLVKVGSSKSVHFLYPAIQRCMEDYAMLTKMHGVAFEQSNYPFPNVGICKKLTDRRTGLLINAPYYVYNIDRNTLNLLLIQFNSFKGIIQDIRRGSARYCDLSDIDLDFIEPGPEFHDARLKVHDLPAKELDFIFDYGDPKLMMSEYFPPDTSSDYDFDKTIPVKEYIPPKEVLAALEEKMPPPIYESGHFIKHAKQEYSSSDDERPEGHQTRTLPFFERSTDTTSATHYDDERVILDDFYSSRPEK